MFINLLDIGLQEWITNAKDFDFDIKNAIFILSEDGPGLMRSDLEDWKLEEKDGQKILFYKEKVYVSRIKIFNKIFSNYITIIKLQDTWGIRNVQFGMTILLVAKTADICQELCERMWNLSTI